MATPGIPSFEMESRRVGPPYRETRPPQHFDFREALQPDETARMVEYHQAQTNAAFHENWNIPEFSAAAVASRIPPLPIYEPHDPRSYQHVPEAFGRDGRFQPSASHTPHSEPSNQSPYQLPSNVSSSRKPHNSLIRASAPQGTEEGELSEGEFEESQPKIHLSNEPVYRTDPHSKLNRDGGPVSIYDTTHEIATEHRMREALPLTDVYGRALDPNRRRSESYSPYEPPQQIGYLPSESRAAQSFADHSTYPEQYEPPYEFEHIINNSRHSELQLNKRPDSPEALYMEQMVSRFTSDSPVLKSLVEARKEAQNAILNLLPLKVRFQDYVDEGIDEEIVRRQFENLGMPPTSIRSAPGKSLEDRNKVEFSKVVKNSPTGREPLLETMNGSRPSFSSEPNNRDTDVSSLKPSMPSSTFTKTDNKPQHNENPTEERKDRIARLLAEKYKKQQSSVLQAKSPKSSASPEAATAGKNIQSAAKADKERLLRQKMEALQKSREQRAQKAAAKSVPINTEQSEQQTKDNVVSLPVSTVQKAPESPQAKSVTPLQVLTLKPLMPTIPGLFLAAAPNTSHQLSNGASTPNITEPVNQRKRPVASDFDGATASSSYKRPFGQSRNDQPLVIDVSDEESEGDEFHEMDVDDRYGNNSVNQTQSGRDTPSTKSIRDLPPLSDFPPRKHFPTPSSAVSTPPALQGASKSSLSKPEDLLRKEMEIQEMKKRIAEFERKKKAKQNLSGSQTPLSNNSSSSPAKVGNASSAIDRMEPSSVQIERLIIDTSRQVDQDQRKLAEAHVVEQEKVDELKQSETEQKRLRRAKIALDLPLVDAEVEKGQKKLAELQAEIASIEAAVQKGLDEKHRLAEELEKLSQEADEQLHVQKNKLRELKLENLQEDRASEEVGDTPSNKVELVLQNEESTSSGISPSEPEPVSDITPSPKPETPLAKLNDLEVILNTTEAPPGSADQSQETRDNANTIPNGEEENVHETMTPDQVLEAALQEATARTEAETSREIKDDVEMVDSFALDPAVVSPSLNGSPSADAQQDDNYDPSTDDLSDVADGESDIYEPPEATPPATDAVISVDSPPFSPAPPETLSESHTDHQPENNPPDSDDVNIMQSPQHTELILPPVPQTNQVHQANPQSVILGQLTGTQKETKPEEARQTYFTPYESPLTNFRAYRFHREFERQVQGGFKSITYSNNIKDDKEFCRYELAGGVCNDPSCEFQHFKDIGLADDAILVELGNSAGYSEEDKPRFVAGLRTVLQGLRAKKTKDFKVIASEIAAYRASFLGDRSKVLLLDTPST